MKGLRCDGIFIGHLAPQLLLITQLKELLKSVNISSSNKVVKLRTLFCEPPGI